MKKLTYLLAILLIAVSGFAQQESKNYIGTWKNEKGEFELKDDGTAVFGEAKASYTYVNGMMTFEFGGGVVLTYTVTVTGNTLTSAGYGQFEVYQRVTGKSSSATGDNQKSATGGREIAGEWCNFGNSTNYSSSSKTWFVLDPNGSYTYGSESSTSGTYGSTAGQSSDAGTWSYDGTNLHINSQTQGVLNYTCTKTYKGRDVALNINGTLFVTTQLREGW